jgi:hypothetical protein
LFVLAIWQAMSILVSSISPDEASDGRYLLEVVSTLTAVGVSIAEADILCDESRTSDMPGKWRFLLQNQDGNKLDYVQVTRAEFVRGIRQTTGPFTYRPIHPQTHTPINSYTYRPIHPQIHVCNAHVYNTHVCYVSVTLPNHYGPIRNTYFERGIRIAYDERRVGTKSEYPLFHVIGSFFE